MRCFNRERGCVCCKKAYNGRAPAIVEPVDFDSSFNEKGFYDLLSKLQSAQFQIATHTSNKLKPSTANQIACYAQHRAQEVARCQHPADRQSQSQLVAPFEMDELKLGSLLGAGGFSYVFEVKSFDTETVATNTSTMSSSTRSSSRRRSSSSSSVSLASAKSYGRDQRKAREFLAHYAVRSQEARDDETSTTKSVSRYAVKHLRPSLLDTPELFAKAAMDLACEAEMMLCLDHPNIVKMRGWSADGPAAYREGSHNSYFLVVDRMVETLEGRIRIWREQWKEQHACSVGTSLLRRLPGRSKRAVEAADSLLIQRVKVAYDVSGAIEYLHEKRIIYRDLKPANVGFDFRGDVKLFDFGLSRHLPESTSDAEETFRMSNVGTRRYAAPEVTSKQPYNLKADIYSMGVTLWEMMTMSSPPSVKKNEPVALREPLVPCSCWPSALQRLVSTMLSLDPAKRPTITHSRFTLKEILVNGPDQEISAELLADEGVSRRRRSTFRLETFDLADLELKGLDDRGLQSHTSVSSFDGQFPAYE